MRTLEKVSLWNVLGLVVLILIVLTLGVFQMAPAQVPEKDAKKEESKKKPTELRYQVIPMDEKNVVRVMFPDIPLIDQMQWDKGNNKFNSNTSYAQDMNQALQEIKKITGHKFLATGDLHDVIIVIAKGFSVEDAAGDVALAVQKVAIKHGMIEKKALVRNLTVRPRVKDSTALNADSETLANNADAKNTKPSGVPSSDGQSSANSAATPPPVQPSPEVTGPFQRDLIYNPAAVKNQYGDDVTGLQNMLVNQGYLTLDPTDPRQYGLKTSTAVTLWKQALAKEHGTVFPNMAGVVDAKSRLILNDWYKNNPDLFVAPKQVVHAPIVHKPIASPPTTAPKATTTAKPKAAPTKPVTPPVKKAS